jgi:TonB family protein
MKLRFLATSLFFVCHLFLSADERVTAAQNLISTAIEKTNIFALPSFVIKANVSLDNNGKPLGGSYQFLWNGPDQWREEITVPGYSEVQVGSKGTIFIKRSVDFTPWRIAELHRTLGYSSLSPDGSFFKAALRPDEIIRKTNDQKVHGTKVKCVEISGPKKSTREVCVDPSTGILVRHEKFLDKEILPIGDRFYPRFLSYLEKEKPVVEVRISEFKIIDRLPDSSFEPPAGATSRAGCLNPSLGRLDHQVNPQYPEQDRLSRIQGEVVIYALIAKDGTIKDARPILGVDPSLNNATLEAIRQWTYEPATCNGVPVEVDITISVNYTLSAH